MEIKPKFCLTTSVAEWRLTLTDVQKLAINTVDELESHLMDEIDALRTTGLDDEEAFMVATKRLGHADVLAAEFRKVSSKVGTLQWGVPHLTGILALLVFVELAHVLNNVLFFSGLKMGIEMTFNSTTLVWAHVLLLVSMIGFLSITFIKYKGKRMTKRLNRIPILIILIICLKTLHTYISTRFTREIIPENMFVLHQVNTSIFFLEALFILLIVAVVIFVRNKKRERMAMVR